MDNLDRLELYVQAMAAADDRFAFVQEVIDEFRMLDYHADKQADMRRKRAH